MEEFYLDAIFMSLSVFLVMGYHAYLWKRLNKKPMKTTMGVQRERRRVWLEKTLQGHDSMQVVQTIRNNLMIIILRASISIAVATSVAALTNNAYKAANKHQGLLFGAQSSPGMLFAVKFGVAFAVSMSSFICSSSGVGFLIDASVLASSAASSSNHVQRLADTGFALAFVGNRLMWLSFVVLLWSLGPIVVVLCSLALVWGFSTMDYFCCQISKIDNSH